MLGKLAVSTAATASTQTTRTPQSMNYPIVLGNDATADNFGGLVGFATSMLICKDGRVVKRVDGLVSYDEIEKAIQSQLEAKEDLAL
jgi:hypothetical protein